MSGFKKYQHIEKFGTDEVEGIDEGTVFVFPKIDGTNSSMWCDEKGDIFCGSRNRELSLENDNAGFMNWASSQDKFKDLFFTYPNLRLFGEWLIPHSLKTYREDAWKEFYVFDVRDGDDYLKFVDYSKILSKYNIQFIPPLCTIKNPREDALLKACEINTYLIQDNKGVGEGIVLKNYEYKNKYGRIVWAKIVTNEFKDKHRHEMGFIDIKQKGTIETKIVDKYVTDHFVDKTYQKIKNESGWNTRSIPRLLQTIFYDLIREESWNFIKENKNPTIDYRFLNKMTILKIKELKPEIF